MSKGKAAARGRARGLKNGLKRRIRKHTKNTVQGLRAMVTPATGKQVIFVAGIQRSGTNMLMGALERHYAVDVYHESDPRAFIDFEMRPPETIGRLIADSKVGVVAIKALCELQYLKHLMTEFAPARTVWMLRNPDDMINSHLRKWSGCPDIIANIIAGRNTGGWRGRGMSAQTLEVISRHFHADIDPASAVALFWYFRNILFFEQGFERDDRVYVARYEPIAQEPAARLAALSEFLGIDYRPGMTRGIFAHSIAKSPPPDIEPPIRDLLDALEDRFDAVIAGRNKPPSR